MKYVDTIIAFDEFPQEITLCVNISGCPNHCPGCHSSYLAEDTGIPLTPDSLSRLIDKNDGVSCIGLLGGDQDPAYINQLAEMIRTKYPNLKVGWYSGKNKISDKIESKNFDFIKYGPYDESKGPLTSPTTNQVFLSKGKHLHKMDANPDEWYDVTNWF